MKYRQVFLSNGVKDEEREHESVPNKAGRELAVGSGGKGGKSRAAGVKERQTGREKTEERIIASSIPLSCLCCRALNSGRRRRRVVSSGSFLFRYAYASGFSPVLSVTIQVGSQGSREISPTTRTTLQIFCLSPDLI